MIEMRLPDYEVIIHIQYNSFGKKLEDQILLETKLYKLDESTEYQGRKDYHRSFKAWEEAVLAGNILKKYCQNPNLLLLKVKTNKTDEKPLIYKG
jgi:hypothetical protein